MVGGLLEREGALAALEAALASARAGSGRIVLVTGEPGVGKTSMVEHFIGSHATCRFLRGQCEALSTPRSLGPVFDFEAALPRGLRELLRAEDDRRSDFYRGLLDELARGEPCSVLVLEDLHWADGATLELVRFIARRIRAHATLVILTARDDAASGATIAPAVGEIASPLLQRVQLQPLSEAGVGAIARGGAWDAGALYRATGGNPFFVTEVLHGDRHGGDVPASVRDAVHARMKPLADAAREFAQAVSIFPRHAPVDDLRALGMFDVASADECVATGLLVLDGAGLRFRHELARASVESSMPATRRLALHGELLRLLAARPAGAVPLARLAHHARQAGDVREILRWAPEAARQAAARGARHEAVAHGEAALAHASQMPPEQHATLLEELADSQFELNLLDAAAASYGRASALFGNLGLTGSQARCLSKQAMPLVRSLRTRDADEVSVAAIRLADRLGDPEVRGQVYAMESYLRMLNRDYREAIDVGSRAISIAQELDRPALLASGLKTSGAALMFLDYEAGCEMLERSAAVAHELADGGTAEADAYLMLGTASGEVHRFATAEHYLEEGIAFARSRDLDRQGLYMEAWHSMCDMALGRWDAASERALAVLAAERQPSTTRLVALITLGRLRARRGDPSAEEVLDEAVDLGLRSGTLQRLGPACVARAEAAWLREDVAAVPAEIARVWDLAIAKGQPWIVGELAYWTQMAGGTPPSLDGCASPYRAQLEGRWQDAAQEWSAIGCPYESARALSAGDEHAQVRALKALDAMSAKPLAARIRSEMRSAGRTAIPRGPAVATRSNAAGLTRRELEVLQLLARNLKSQEIATRLSRSVRTVDHHLESLYAKLDVTGRTQAVTRAHELGLIELK